MFRLTFDVQPMPLKPNAFIWQSAWDIREKVCSMHVILRPVCTELVCVSRPVVVAFVVAQLLASVLHELRRLFQTCSSTWTKPQKTTTQCSCGSSRPQFKIGSQF